MVELRRILCPVDLSDLSIRALAYANSIAERYRSELTALHVVPTFEPMEVRAGALFDPVRFVYPMTRAQIDERLRDAMSTAGVAVDRSKVVAEAGEPSEVIVDQALTTGADLVVMATHGRTGWNRLMLGSVTEKVLRTAPCPVLTVPPHARQSPPETVLKSILCPVDFSPAAVQAVGLAADLARRANAAVTYLHVVEWLAEEEPREAPYFAVQEFRRHLMQDARERLETVITKQPRIEGGAVARVAAGRAYREILQIGSEVEADLIVMGALGRGGVPLTRLGSTTQQVVRAASCPVLTVHAPGRPPRRDRREELAHKRAGEVAQTRLRSATWLAVVAVEESA